MSRRANPTLRSVFTDDILPGSGKKQGKTAVQSFPKKTASAAVAAPAVAAQVASRDYSSRAPASKCCSIKNCDEEPLVVGGDTESGAIAVSILQEPSTAPLCVVSTHGCAPRQRPVENSVCLYTQSGTIYNAIGGLYPLLCIEEGDDAICTQTIDFAIVYLNASFDVVNYLGNMSIMLVSDIGVPFHQVTLKNVADLMMTTNNSGFFLANNRFPSQPCVLAVPTPPDTLSTAIFRLDLAKVYGGGWTIPPRNVLAIDYCADVEAFGTSVRSISVVARGTTQAKNCNVDETVGQLSRFVVNLTVERTLTETLVNFCVVNCLGDIITPGSLNVTFSATDDSSASSQIIPQPAPGACYSASFSLLNTALLWILTVQSGTNLLYSSCPIAFASA